MTGRPAARPEGEAQRLAGGVAARMALDSAGCAAGVKIDDEEAVDLADALYGLLSLAGLERDPHWLAGAAEALAEWMRARAP